jgi:predicted glycoside hydrolase/deacetylase ChbG (UPF0249 family)
MRALRSIVTVVTLLTALPAFAQSLAERLGYARDAKLLIVHADDLGMAHSVNAASIKALETGLVNSASIMVPCPWFSEIAAYARAHPEMDLGLHLTLTSEWKHFRWGPVLSKGRVPSLFDPDGYLYITEDVAAAKIDPRHAEAEIRAQIDRARKYGVQPTHLDSHMRTLHQNAALFGALLRVSRATKIPTAIPREFLEVPWMAKLIRPDDIVIDRFISIGDDVPADKWADFYINAIKTLEPGVTELIVHVAYDDAEMRAATIDHPAWGSAWRQRDFDFLTSDAFRRLLTENNVRLVTWREIGQKLWR